jgi:hypothetical protein
VYICCLCTSAVCVHLLSVYICCLCTSAVCVHRHHHSCGRACACACSETIGALQLKSSRVTDLKVLFDEPWLVEKSHHGLVGSRPRDRDLNSLTCLGGAHRPGAAERGVQSVCCC